MDSGGAATPKAWEETFVEDFISKRGLKLSTNEYIGALNEANVFKYILQPKENNSSWVDGAIFVYDRRKIKWYPRSQKVKFLVLPEEFNEITKKIEVYERTNELIKSGSRRSVVTPIFTTYSSRLDRMLVCYPTFDGSFAEWINQHNGGGGSGSLPDMMTTMIRDLLDVIPQHDIRGLEQSLVHVKTRKVKTPDVFKLILLPYQGAISHEAERRTSFATFLRNNLPQNWLDLDVDAFLGMLESQNYTLEDVQGHPILQDGDSIGRLILDCFRDDLTPQQVNVLAATVDVNRFDSGAWYQRLQGNDVLLKMSTFRSGSQAYDLLWFARKTVAHMNENMSKYFHKTLVRTYPGITIKELYVGFISDLYRLYLNPQYLTKVT